MGFLSKFKSFLHLLLAWAAFWRYGRPARKLIVIGVTGTKGKSTTCRLIASVLEAGGYKVGLLSTVEFQIGEKRWLNNKKMTMLGRGQIQKMLRDMVRAGCQYAVVETSSEGILQHRQYGLNYDVAVFTNLGTEHSERHGGLENLKRDKGKLFKALQSPRKSLGRRIVPKVSVVNADDPQAPLYAAYLADRHWAYSLKNSPLAGSECVLGSISQTTDTGTIFMANGEEYQLNIVGDFNVTNALAAIAVGYSQGVAQEKMRQGLLLVGTVPGRMEFIEAGQNFKAVVDYAHEPMSYTALFNTLRALVAREQGKVIAVIGSDGGGRDIGKRGAMGEIAGRLADYVIVSDVNCFDDDPKEIAEMLAAGARREGKKDGEDLFVIIDRREGIRQALSLAHVGDIVAVTAKGTEQWIAVGQGEKIPWDDRRVVREEIQSFLRR
ncbi:MAG: UDP-N-acetylmuramyl-tripeptide synthetase [Candidatus Magasanikbacteria bacterium]|nr:UDP-N-acetylmuramyl-tripeptide synthetase [Candidatus Magasanikbacteria bacterium]